MRSLRSLLLLAAAIALLVGVLASGARAQQANEYWFNGTSGVSCPSCWTPVSPSTPLVVTSAGSNQPASPMQSQLSVTTAATVTLTIPTGAVYATIGLRQGAASCINYSTDGSTTPTTGATGNGKQICAGQTVSYSGAKYLSNFQAIATTATTAIDVEYGK